MLQELLAKIFTSDAFLGLIIGTVIPGLLAAWWKRQSIRKGWAITGLTRAIQWAEEHPKVVAEFGKLKKATHEMLLTSKGEIEVVKELKRQGEHGRSKK